MAEKNKMHDKGYKKILSKKKNFLNFLKFFVGEEWSQKLTEENIELTENEFILMDYERKESDIIYRAKIEDKEIYFYTILELQSRPDFTMPFRLLMYMTELMNRIFSDTENNIRQSKDFRMPCVIPIVLHNGVGNWSAVQSFREYQNGYEMFGSNIIDFKYILINVNSLDEDELGKIENIMSYVFTFDKKQSLKKFMDNLRIKAKTFGNLTMDEQTDFIEWIKMAIINKYPNNRKVDEVIKYFEIGDERNMTYAIENLFDEVIEDAKKKGMEEGREEGMEKAMINVAKKMIGKGMNIEEIIEYTGLSRERLAEIK